MEKNMVVVCDSEIGVPFVLMPMGRQVLLLSPGLELSRLKVEAQNWDNDDREYSNNYESRFDYFCLTGEEVSSNRMFVLMMKNLYCGNGKTISELMETLSLWDISCDYTPVNTEIRLDKSTSGGHTTYCYRGDGFYNIGIGNITCLADCIGHSLLHALRANVFPEINMVIRNYDLNQSELNVLKQKLMSVVGEEKDIHITFKDKEY